MSIFLKGQSGVAFIDLLLMVTIMAVLASVVVPSVIPFITSNEQRQGIPSELDAVQTAVRALMVDKGLSAVSPVTTPTNDMASFPESANALHPRYLRKATTGSYYTCTSDGRVSQVITGYLQSLR